MSAPYGYLITLVPIAICTLFALAAPRRPASLARLGFGLGLAVNELPFAARVLPPGAGFRTGRRSGAERR
ncbi:hypothetical protein [Nonomuraea sp. NPDC002799]